MAFVDLIVVALIVVAVVLVLQNRARSGRATVDPEAARLADEVRELRARIHVLERAITDNHGSADLSSEIERLRDR